MKRQEKDGIPPLVRLDSLEDLKRVLLAEKMIAQAAYHEIKAAMPDGKLPKGGGAAFGKEELDRMVAAQRKILEKYANYPSLSEYAYHPALFGASKWGATFGVAILVRVLILEPVKSLLPHASPVAKHSYLAILKELSEPMHSCLIDSLAELLDVKIDCEATPVPQATKKFARKVMYRIAEAFLAASSRYGIVDVGLEGSKITFLGRRIYLHLTDAEQFVSELIDAHEKIFLRHPKLSCI